MVAGDDILRDDGATVRGRAPWTRFASSRSRSEIRAGGDEVGRKSETGTTDPAERISVMASPVMYW